MDKEEGFTGFSCPVCNTEIEASMDLVGEETECPACGAKITVPDGGDDGVVRHGSGDPSARQAMKSRTIRIELDDL